VIQRLLDVLESAHTGQTALRQLPSMSQAVVTEALGARVAKGILGSERAWPARATVSDDYGQSGDERAVITKLRALAAHSLSSPSFGGSGVADRMAREQRCYSGSSGSSTRSTAALGSSALDCATAAPGRDDVAGVVAPPCLRLTCSRNLEPVESSICLPVVRPARFIQTRRCVRATTTHLNGEPYGPLPTYVCHQLWSQVRSTRAYRSEVAPQRDAISPDNFRY
jgi:hypothetical protein